MATDKEGQTVVARPLSSFTLVEQRAILALVRLEDSPPMPAAATSPPRPALGHRAPRKERKTT